jgi:2',3'-cyclic-nucleotide 2'-phosphodiesterase (5'-nucleotidase family)
MDNVRNVQGAYIQRELSEKEAVSGPPPEKAQGVPTAEDSVSITGPQTREKKLPSAGQKSPIELRIAHLNDIHGNIEPQVEKSIASQGLVGGLAYMGSVVKTIRMEDPETLLINAGDVVQGSFESEVSHGKPIMEVMNYLHFDAVELGNHDFAQGRKALYELIDGVEAPILGANIIDAKTSRPIEGVESSIIRDIKGVKVGIIGVDTPKIPEYVRPEEIAGMTFPKPEEMVKRQIDELKKKGVDLIIVTSHLGLKEDRELAEKVPGIDVIVGGHTHSTLPEGERVGNTVIVQAGCNNQYVGDLKLSVDPSSKKIIAFSSRLIPIISESIQPDPAIEGIIAPYLEQGKKAGSEIVGKTVDEMRYSFKEVTPLGQHIADAMRSATGAKLALCSGKMLRAGLKKGDINRKELFNSYPNTEDVVTVKLSGKHIKEELESRFAADSRAIILPSGFSFTVDTKRPDGDRIASITVDGEPMDMEKEYDLAVTDNQARYGTFKTARDLKTVCSLREAWFDYVKNHSPLTNELDGRITMA